MRWLTFTMWCMAVAGTAPAGGARAATVTVCEEAEVSLLHPAEYVQEKVKRHGWLCALNPICCTPAWVTSPDCYAWQWVKKKNAWTEIKKTFPCKGYQLTAKDVFDKWLANLEHPIPGFHLIPSEIMAVFAGYAGEAYDVAKPIAEPVRSTLDVMARSGRHAFTTLDLGKARVLSASHPLAKPIWPGGNCSAITYYNLILSRPEIDTKDVCTRVAHFAHELAHVHQYSAMGWDSFAEKYLLDGVNGYTNIPFEKQAFAESELAYQECLRQPGRPAKPAVDPGRVERDRTGRGGRTLTP